MKKHYSIKCWKRAENYNFNLKIYLNITININLKKHLCNPVKLKDLNQVKGIQKIQKLIRKLFKKIF